MSNEIHTELYGDLMFTKMELETLLENLVVKNRSGECYSPEAVDDLRNKITRVLNSKGTIKDLKTFEDESGSDTKVVLDVDYGSANIVMKATAPQPNTNYGHVSTSVSPAPIIPTPTGSWSIPSTTITAQTLTHTLQKASLKDSDIFVNVEAKDGAPPYVLQFAPERDITAYESVLLSKMFFLVASNLKSFRPQEFIFSNNLERHFKVKS